MSGDGWFYQSPQPCPSCGHCPTCGHSPSWQMYPYNPWTLPNTTPWWDRGATGVSPLTVGTISNSGSNTVNTANALTQDQIARFG